MNSDHKKTLRAISLELRHTLEGTYDERGDFQPGDLERRLNAIGVWRERPSKPLTELTHLPDEDKAARHTVDAYLRFRAEAGVGQAEGVAEFVREAAYNWANRLLTLRCMEARGIIDEVILQKEVYGRRSLLHNRLGQQNPALLAQPDEGLFTVLLAEFGERARELPALFNPKAPAIALRPSLAALKKCIGLLSGTVKAGSYLAEGDDLFAAPDALGWAYQYWNAEEKDRVFEKVRTEKGAKIAGADIIPATQLYTEPYMVKFLVQNSLGALWQGMHPDSDLADGWDYYVRDADRAPVDQKPVRDLTFLDPACGSGHFHLEAFDLLYQMYAAEANLQSPISSLQSPEEICAAILNHNLYGIDIDERAIQIAQAALWMKAKELAWELQPEALTSFHHHFVATNIRLPRGEDHLHAFLQKHPEDRPLQTALETVFEGLENAHELGSLLQLEEPVEKELRYLQGKQVEAAQTLRQGDLFAELAKPRQGELPLGVESYDAWKTKTLAQLRAHFESEAEAADLTQAFFGQSADKGLTLFDLLARRYDIVAANPPYMGSKNMGDTVRKYVAKQYEPGKRDLYAAFIIRCIEFVSPYGRVSMVTRNSWLFLKYYAALRWSDSGQNIGILRDCRIECLTDIGPHGFSEIGGEIVNAVMFCLAHESPFPNNSLMYAIRLVSEGSPNEKEQLLKISASEKNAAVTTPKQAAFQKIPLYQILYWLPDGLIDAFSKSDLLYSQALVREGIHTSSSDRFVRYSWECSPIYEQRWFRYAKGGGYQKWLGLEYFRCEWEFSGARIKATGKAIIPSEDLYFVKGFSYSKVGGAAFSARLMDNAIFSDAGQAIFPKNSDEVISFLNTRLASYFLRLISPTLDFNKGYVELCPIPRLTNEWDGITSSMGSLKTRLLVNRIESDYFDFQISGSSSSLVAECYKNLLSTYAYEAYLLLAEACLETYWSTTIGLTNSEILLYQQEVGRLSGAFPLLAHYSHSIEPSDLPQLTNILTKHVRSMNLDYLSTDQPSNLIQNLSILFAAGPKANIEEVDLMLGESEENILTTNTLIPIPTESYLEELSIRLQIHPISIYWLLKEGIEQEGWRCPPEEKRLTEDSFTVTVLRLLGHRWPKQIAANEPVPSWAELGGIIPITNSGSNQPTLYDRVRGRLAADFPNGNPAAIEREFAEIVGEKLADWLAGSFFTRHISQFKKRPIAWQLQTSPAPGQRQRGGPAFAALLYYHKLSADLLPTLRSQFVRDLIRAYETEQRTLRQSQSRSSDQEARLRQLEIWLSELQTFSDALQFVSDHGFGDTPALQATLRQFALDDAMQSLKAAWLGRLAAKAASDALPDWQTRADKTNIHPALRDWIATATANLAHHCAQVGAPAPRVAKLQTDPDARTLAVIIGSQAKEMVAQSLKLAGDAWFTELDENLLRPLLDEVNGLKAELGALEEKRNSLDTQDVRSRYEAEQKIKSLKAQIKQKSKVRNDHRKAANELRDHIESWRCPTATSWTEWLGQQPLFDEFASLDGQRQPPQTIAEFVAQESRYVPDINDGVRVNIAPLQKAGLLAADVLAAKDLDKAIADRADWRADERRWCREGKLPQPGWWAYSPNKGN